MSPRHRLVLMLIILSCAPILWPPAPAARATNNSYTPGAFGEVDCNGRSPIQKPIRPALACADVRGFAGIDNAYTWGGHFYDNGVYIGHDEPDMTFLSQQSGSGDDLTWTETLGSDPSAVPTVTSPGSDVSHWFELTTAPWFSMALCDSNSYPQLPCTAESDANAPTCPDGNQCDPHSYPGAGSAIMEMQLYPPGFPPFVDSVSCDDTHWCAALTIDSLECTDKFNQCNTNCVEPVNFAFIQTNGVPAGPPSPQNSTLASSTPNANTLLMNPGDQITVHMFDAPDRGGGSALEVMINDLTTGQSGFMQASAANGFANTSIVDCSGTPFNFEPEYSTARAGNVVPWTALQTNISTEYETGHFEGCTSLSSPITPNPFDASDTGGTYNACSGLYESAGSGVEGAELTDGLCYQAGDTHTGYNGAGTSTPPNVVSGCLANLAQNGDLDFDGTPYWPEWPAASTATASLPASFVQALPTSNGQQYSEFFFQTDVALSESTCGPSSPQGCALPPPNAPGNFYPFWAEVASNGTCNVQFGNVAGSGVNSFAGVAQFGSDQVGKLGYDEFEGATYFNSCPARVAKLGDVNGDEVVNAVDALCVLRIVAAMPSTTACPIPPPGNPIIVSGETAPTATDALCILRGVVGLPATATCPAITAQVASSQETAVSSAGSELSSAQNGSSRAEVQIGLVPKTVKISPGGSTTASLQAEIQSGTVGAWAIDIRYDPTAIRVTDCKAEAGSLCNASFAPGIVRASGASPGGLTGSQKLAAITLSAIGKAGDSSPLKVAAQTVADTAGKALSTSVEGSTIQIGPQSPGTPSPRPRN